MPGATVLDKIPALVTLAVSFRNLGKAKAGGVEAVNASCVFIGRLQLQRFLFKGVTSRYPVGSPSSQP